MLHNIQFMEQFRGYSKWPSELQMVAKERLLHEYTFDRTYGISWNDYIQEVITIIEEDIEFYEKFEEYEICQILKELQEEL